MGQTNNKTEDFALGYAKRSLSVIPVKENSKEPLFSWKEFQERRASEEEINWWWFTTPASNVAIVTGRISRLAVLDCDGGAGALTLSTLSLPPTPCVKTPHGTHLYFSIPPAMGVVKTIPQGGWGLKGCELKAEGGYVLAPPSVINGVVYSWMNGGMKEEKASLSDVTCLLPYMNRDSVSPHPHRDAITIAEAVKGVAEGSRHINLVRIASALYKKGVDFDSVISYLLWVNSHNTPPLDEKEVVSIATSLERSCYKPSMKALVQPGQDSTLAPILTVSQPGQDNVLTGGTDVQVQVKELGQDSVPTGCADVLSKLPKEGERDNILYNNNIYNNNILYRASLDMPGKPLSEQRSLEGKNLDKDTTHTGGTDVQVQVKELGQDNVLTGCADVLSKLPVGCGVTEGVLRSRWIKPIDQLGPVKEITWRWEGYLADEQTTLLVGGWKTGKTTLIASLIREMINGGELAGRKVAKSRILVFSEENDSRWKHRSERYGFNGPSVFMLNQPFLGKPSKDEWFTILDDISKNASAYDVIIVDTLANLWPIVSENDNGLVGEVILRFRDWTKLGKAVMLIHHPRKGYAVPGQRARGAGVLQGFVDTIIEFEKDERHGPATTKRTLNGASRNEETPREVFMDFVEGKYVFIASEDTQTGDNGVSMTILGMLPDRPEDAINTTRLYDIYPGIKPSRKTLYRHLERLVEEGKVVSINGGTQGKTALYYLAEEGGKEEVGKYGTKILKIPPRGFEPLSPG